MVKKDEKLKVETKSRWLKSSRKFVRKYGGGRIRGGGRRSLGNLGNLGKNER